MNKVFRVLWNHATQSFVVTSELSKSKGKSSNKTDKRVAPTLLAIAVGSASALIGGSAMAATAATSLSTVYYEQGAHHLAVGSTATANPNNSANDGGNKAVSTGINATTTGQNSVVYGVNVNATGVGAVALGSNATAKGDMSLAIGANARGYKETTAGPKAIAIGSRAYAEGENSVAIGYNTTANQTDATALGHNAWATGAQSTAVGVKAQATQNGATATGWGAKATNQYATATGAGAVASGRNSVATGPFSEAIGNQAIATGYLADAIGNNSIATGHQASATGGGAIAEGRLAVANGTGAIATGIDSNATGAGAYAAGSGAKAQDPNTIAIGTNSVANGTNSTSIGSSGQVDGDKANALGDDNTVTGDGSSVQGNNNNVSGTNTTVTGNNNNITSNNTMIVGNNITLGAGHDGAVIIGDNSDVGPAVIRGWTNTTVTGTNGRALVLENFQEGKIQKPGQYVSIGSAEEPRMLINLASGKIGPNSTDAINGGQLYAVTDQLNSLIGNVQNAPLTFTANANKDEARQVENVVYVKRAVLDENGKETFDEKSQVIYKEEIETFIVGDFAAANGAERRLDETISFVGAAKEATSETKQVQIKTSDGQDALDKDGNALMHEVTTYTLEGNSTGVVDLKRDTTGPTAGKYTAKNIQTVVTTKGDAAEIQIQLADNPVFNSTTIGGITDPATGTVTKAPIQIGTVTDPKTSEPKNVISGLDSSLPGTYNNDALNPADKDGKTQPVTAEQKLPENAKDIVSNAATVGDILNAGWNLQENAVAKDFVKAYDTVNFVNGTGTIANVSVNTDGTIANVTYNIDKGTVAPVTAGDKQGSVAGPVTTEKAKELADALKDAQDKLKEAQDKLAALPADAPEADKTAAETALADATKAAADAEKAAAPLNQVATAQNVAEAINASGWKLAANGTAGTELINPSDTVTFKAGENLNVTRDGSNITYSLDKDLTNLSTVTVGAPGVDGKDGQPGTPGVDGKVAVNGKDGASVVVNGKDGSIGLTGPKGPAGADGTPGKDGASATLSVADGKPGVDGTNGINGQPGESKTRIVYTPVDPATGNPAVDDKGKPIVEEVATLNDGLKFTGNNNATTNVHKLNTLVNIVGEGVNATTAATFKSAKGNINVKADGNATLEIQLASNLTNITSISNGNTSMTLGDGNVTFTNGNNPVTIGKVANNLPSTYNKDALNTANNPVTTNQSLPANATSIINNAATVGDILNSGWNLRTADKGALDFVKAYDTVEFVNGQGTTVTSSVDANGTTSKIQYNVAVDNTTTRLTSTAPNGDAIYQDKDGNWKTVKGDAPVTLTQAQKDALVTKVSAIPTGSNVSFNGGNVEGDVNFVDSNTTSITTDPVTGDIKFEVKTGDTATEDGKAKVDTSKLEDAVKAAEEAKEKLAADATPEQIAAADKAIADAKDAVKTAGDKVATVGDIVNTINNAGWKTAATTVKTPVVDAEGKPVLGADGKPTYTEVKNETVLVTPGSQVDYVNGQNTKANVTAVKNADGTVTTEVTYDVAGDLTNITSISNGNMTMTLGDGNVTFTNGNNPVTIGKVANNLPSTYNKDALNTANNPVTTNQSLPANVTNIISNAATVGDILNSGWNLRTADKGALDFVKAYDTVEFVNGQGTTVTSSVNTNGTNSTIQYNVNVDGKTTKITYVGEAAEGQPAPELTKVGDKFYPADQVNADGSLKDGAKEYTGNVTSQVTALVPTFNGNSTTGGNINFVNGNTTTITTAPDGNITVEVKTGDITNTDGGKAVGPVTPELENTLKDAEKTLAELPADASQADKDAAEKAVKDAKDALDTAKNEVATAQNVADAINNSGWTTTATTVKTPVVDAEGNPVLDADGKPTYTEVKDTPVLVTPGSKVDYVDGKNTKANVTAIQNADGTVTTEVTYDVVADPTFNSTTIGGKPADENGKGGKPAITIGTVTNPKTGDAKNVISGLDTTLPDVVNSGDDKKHTTNVTAPKAGDINTSNAATLGDVLNAGWNLQENGTAKDFVKAYDTVNFVNGTGTTANVSMNTDGTVANVTYNVNVDGKTTVLSYKGKDGKTTYYAIPNEDGTVTYNTKPNGKGDVVDAANIDFTKGSKVTALTSTGVNGENIGGDVNFVDGNTTTISTDPTTGDIKIEVNTGESSVTENGSAAIGSPALTEKVENAVKELTNVQDALANLPADATAEQKAAAEKAVADAKAKLAAADAEKLAAGDKVATVGDIVETINNVSWTLTTAGNTDTKDVSEKITAGEVVTINAGSNINVSQKGGEITIEAMRDLTEIDTITVGKDGKDGKDGVDGSIAVNGKDGASVAINGKDGSIGLTGARGEDGKDGASATLAVKDGRPGVDGTNGINGEPSETKTRIVYTPVDPTTGKPAVDDKGKPIVEEVATLNDGLKFKGNGDKTVEKKLNETLTIKGDLAETAPASAENVRVDVNEKGELVVKIAENPTFTNVEVKETLTAKEVKTDRVEVINGPVITKDGIDAKGTTISNVKAGEKPTDAVNVSQLETVKETANAGWNVNSTAVAGSTGKVTVDSTPTATKVAPRDTVNVNAGNNIEIARNGSTIAIATSMTPTFNTVQVGGSNGVTVGASTAADGVKELSVGTAQAPTRITNVAPGVKDTDAVNVSQLKQVKGDIAGVKNDIANVNNRINKVDRNLRGGIAGAAAIAGLPQVRHDGKSMVAVGAGNYRGESAVAVGYSRASDNGKVLLKLSGSANTRGDVVSSVGVGYEW
ncbi:hypothetical protein A1D22_07385 [Pasteurellaceae bacterium LFhippo2]|nr:hypothetical protein [Pasteurellaceae bacterium LFhippo2]